MRHLVVPRTLSFLFHGDEVLVLKRSPHARLFPGKVNGVGGHVERNEDVVAAAHREIHEETGLQIPDLWLAGILHVDGVLGQADPLPGGYHPGVMVFIFTGQAPTRNVIPSDEGELLWVPLTAVSSLDWVDGDPGLLLQALDSHRLGRPFFTHKP
jgi:8-oxo-dGTP diphosphatase